MTPETQAAIIWAGAGAFGIVVGYITYRTLVRVKDSGIADIAAVIAAIGGGAITGLFTGVGFAFYAFGLLVGMAIFLILRVALERDGVVILGSKTDDAKFGG